MAAAASSPSAPSPPLAEAGIPPPSDPNVTWSSPSPSATSTAAGAGVAAQVTTEGLTLSHAAALSPTGSPPVSEKTMRSPPRVTASRFCSPGAAA